MPAHRSMIRSDLSCDGASGLQPGVHEVLHGDAVLMPEVGGAFGVAEAAVLVGVDGVVQLTKGGHCFRYTA